MAFAVYTYVTQSAPILTGDVFTIPYDVGDGQYSFAGSGEHLATGPFEQLFTEPEAFDATFQAGQVQIEWKTTAVPIGNLVRFQFARTANPMVDGMPVALADLSNADVTDFAMGLLQAESGADLEALGLAPIASPAFIGNPTAPTPAPGDADTSIATTEFVADALDALIPPINDALALKANIDDPTFTGMAAVQAFRLGGIVTPATITASVDNYNPPDLADASILRVSSDSPNWFIRGLAGGTAGRVLVLQNAGATNVQLAAQHPNSLAANRFLLAENRILNPGHMMVLTYDAASARWGEVNAFDPRLRGSVQDPYLWDGLTPIVPLATKNFAVAMAAAL